MKASPTLEDLDVRALGRCPQKHISRSILWGCPYLVMGFIIRGFIWDIPILIFAYVLFCGPIKTKPQTLKQGNRLTCRPAFWHIPKTQK